MSFKAKKNIQLQPWNSFALNAVAAYYSTLTDKQQIPEAVQWAVKKQLQYVVIGEGSNIILRPELEALVLRNQIKGVELLSESSNSVVVRVGAGENWHQLVQTTSESGWHGLENLALIPGSVGAAPVQNIGAYGVEVSSFINKVHAWDALNNCFVELGNAECKFEYRNSLFRKNSRFIISHVEFELSKSFTPVLTYAPLKKQFSNTPSLVQLKPQQLIDYIIEIRQSKLPMPSVLPNVGSFFKNPVVSVTQFNALKQQYPDIVSYPAGGKVKLAAAWLLEQAGLKGERLGNLGIYDKQALVMVNYGELDGTAVLRFAAQIQDIILTRFSVHLEMEPVVI